MIVTEIEAIEHLDFDFETPCEANGGCDNTAEWVFTMNCCGFTSLFCDPHAQNTIDIHELWVKVKRLAICKQCKARFLVATEAFTARRL